MDNGYLWVRTVTETVLFRLLLAVLLLWFAAPAESKPRGYRKATEGRAVVIRKLFPKKKPHRSEC